MLSIKDFEKKWEIRFCFNHSGKMTGMVSLSTSCACNWRCKAHANIKGSICEHCYAATMFEYRKSTNDKYATNTKVLTSVVIPKKDWPLINAAYIRLEAFGDLINETQVINYFNFCNANKHAKVALWTKNAQLIDNAIKAGYKKPSNLIIIVSSLFVNQVSSFKYSFIDKVFTVYDKKYATENNINITCGARNCLTCRRCYRKTKDIEYVNELLK